MPKHTHNPDRIKTTAKEKRSIVTGPRVLGAVALTALGMLAHERISDATALQAARTELATINEPHREVIISRADGPNRYPDLLSLARAIVKKNADHGFELNALEVNNFLYDSLDEQMHRDGNLQPDQQLGATSIPSGQVIEIPDSWGVGQRVAPKIDSAESTS
jgi:hypothetical protein